VPEGTPAQNAMKYVEWYGGKRCQTYTTPFAFFFALFCEFEFTMDGAAAGAADALLPKFSSPSNPLPWEGERVFCNPPWSNIRPFVELAPASSFACLLVPARTNARWFHRALALGATPRFWEGRLKFGAAKSSSPVDCLLLLFGKP